MTSTEDQNSSGRGSGMHTLLSMRRQSKRKNTIRNISEAASWRSDATADTTPSKSSAQITITGSTSIKTEEPIQLSLNKLSYWQQDGYFEDDGSDHEISMSQAAGKSRIATSTAPTSIYLKKVEAPDLLSRGTQVSVSFRSITLSSRELSIECL